MSAAWASHMGLAPTLLAFPCCLLIRHHRAGVILNSRQVALKTRKAHLQLRPNLTSVADGAKVASSPSSPEISLKEVVL
jgi:hypothetical protein